MFKKITIISTCLLSGCGNNYLRTGMFRDRYDKGFYNYIETGKRVSIDNNNAINLSVGLHSQRGDNIEDSFNRGEYTTYGEVNYEVNF